jgi:SAM-dependent methyltransferase
LVANPFDSAAMAAGYAHARPALHQPIVDLIGGHLGLGGPVETALDVGCGAGRSTVPLTGLAHRVLGIDPAPVMVALAATVAPSAGFAVGRAEALPVRPGSIDLITAAGSLDFADPLRFRTEAARALRPGGVLAVYDFAQGSSDQLRPWYAELTARYPEPADLVSGFDPGSLSGHALMPAGYERFTIGLDLSRDQFVDYVLTEPAAAHAVRRGADPAALRAWCAGTLAPIFQPGRHEVRFPGYFACWQRSP